jgi:hypothetical protein
LGLADAGLKKFALLKGFSSEGFSLGMDKSAPGAILFLPSHISRGIIIQKIIIYLKLIRFCSILLSSTVLTTHDP